MEMISTEPFRLTGAPGDYGYGERDTCCRECVDLCSEIGRGKERKKEKKGGGRRQVSLETLVETMFTSLLSGIHSCQTQGRTSQHPLYFNYRSSNFTVSVSRPGQVIKLPSSCVQNCKDAALWMDEDIF